MTAAPLNDGQDDRLHGAQFDAASEALARHWQKLGLSRYDDDPSEEDRAPRLYAFSNEGSYVDEVRRFCRWSSPTQE